MALTLTSRQGIQHSQWQHSPTPTPMFPLSFPTTHTPSPSHSLRPTIAQMQMPTPSPAPSAHSFTSTSTLSSIPVHNTRELTREMLVTVLEHFSTVLPSRFEDHPVRLVVHGGACMLLHPDLDKLAAQTPPFLSLPPGFDSYYTPIPPPPQSHALTTCSPFSSFPVSHNAAHHSGSPPMINDNSTTARPPTPPPEVKRTSTRDVDVILRSFDSEWRQIGITNATGLLKECVALTAKKFGLGLDWMNSDPDVAMPMAYDPTSNTTYDPVHTDALKPNNIARHTVYTSTNGLLQFISVSPVWAVALKLVRFTKSDPGDICLILRNGTNISGTKWTEDIVVNWLVTQCWPMGYRDYDPLKWGQLRAKIKFVVAMVNTYSDVPKGVGMEREKIRTPTPTRALLNQSSMQPYQVPVSYQGGAMLGYNVPPSYCSPKPAKSSPPIPPPPPPKDSPPLKSSSTFLPRSIADWSNMSTPTLLPAPAFVHAPLVAGQGRDGKAQVNRRATEPVIPPFLGVEPRERGRSRERRTQTWPLVGSLPPRGGGSKDGSGERDSRERRDKKGDQEDRTRRKVVDWLKANNRHRREGSGAEGGDKNELPVVPSLAHPPSPPRFRDSPPRDVSKTRGSPVIPMITVADASLSGIRAVPSDDSDTLTITEVGEKSPWHPYHQQRASGLDAVVPDRSQHRHQEQDTYSWIRRPQTPAASAKPPISGSRQRNEEGEAFVPPLPSKSNDDDDDEDDEDDLASNTLLLSFSSDVGVSTSSPLATPAGFVPYPLGTPVIPAITTPTMPGMVAPVYSPASFPGYPGTPAGGFPGFYGGMAPPYQQPHAHAHTPYNQSQDQESHHGQEWDKEISNRRGISSWI